MINTLLNTAIYCDCENDFYFVLNKLNKINNNYNVYYNFNFDTVNISENGVQFASKDYFISNKFKIISVDEYMNLIDEKEVYISKDNKKIYDKMTYYVLEDNKIKNMWSNKNVIDNREKYTNLNEINKFIK